MPSKYKVKNPKKVKKLPIPYPVCTNCGEKSSLKIHNTASVTAEERFKHLA